MQNHEPSPNTGPIQNQELDRSIRIAIGASDNLRRKRFTLFKELVSTLPRPLSILDVGGTKTFWETMGFGEYDIRIVLLNLTRTEVSYPYMTSVSGDARDMSEFGDKEFDVVFSNSVIEHVGDYYQQKRMANEVLRVGKRFFLQTPNRSFPVESHFFYPLFQFYPLWLRLFIGHHLDVGWFKYIKGKEKEDFVRSLRLLSETELQELFPGAVIRREKFLGLTKSLLVHGGWENNTNSLGRSISAL